MIDALALDILEISIPQNFNDNATMLMKITPGRQFTVLFLITLTIILLNRPLLYKAYADEHGEIININEELQIVFTGLGSNILKRGDIVKVLIDENEFIYLEVIEVSSILSKLGPVDKNGFKTDPTQINKLAIGNTVIKISEENRQESMSKSSLPDDNTQSWDDTKQLEDALHQTKEQLNQLQQDNLSLRNEIQSLSAEKESMGRENLGRANEINQLKSLIADLKIRLENMHKMLQHNEK